MGILNTLDFWRRALSGDLEPERAKALIQRLCEIYPQERKAAAEVGSAPLKLPVDGQRYERLRAEEIWEQIRDLPPEAWSLGWTEKLTSVPLRAMFNPISQVVQQSATCSGRPGNLVDVARTADSTRRMKMSNKSTRKAMIITLSLIFMALPAAAVDPVIRNGIDLWVTGDEGKTFFDFSSEPIPAGFFCSGSARFNGKVTFKGEPIATSPSGALGGADTIVQRLDDAPFDERGVAQTRVRVRALSFSSIEPLETACGPFQVSVSLDGQQPVTRMKIVRDHDEGGRYFAPISLRVRVTFTPLAGRSSEPLELSRSATFPTLSDAFWSSRPGNPSFSHEGVVLVDTEGDGKPDTFLPGTSNFAPGWRFVPTRGNQALPSLPEQPNVPEQSPTQHCMDAGEGCHCMLCEV